MEAKTASGMLCQLKKATNNTAIDPSNNNVFLISVEI